MAHPPEQSSSVPPEEFVSAERLSEALAEYFDRSDVDDDDFFPEPIVSDDSDVAGDVHRAFSAYRASLKKRLPPVLSKIRHKLFQTSRKGDMAAIGHAEEAAQWLEDRYGFEQPKRSHYPCPEHYARDKWIYDNWGLGVAKLSSELKQKAPKEHWCVISSRQAFYDAHARFKKHLDA